MHCCYAASSTSVSSSSFLPLPSSPFSSSTHEPLWQTPENLSICKFTHVSTQNFRDSFLYVNEPVQTTSVKWKLHNSLSLSLSSFRYISLSLLLVLYILVTSCLLFFSSYYISLSMFLCFAQTLSCHLPSVSFFYLSSIHYLFSTRSSNKFPCSLSDDCSLCKAILTH